ncbi:ubiquitin carboxyl-terminal hydrolase isozyme L3 [Prorops nasuta]|uniref:ubiquitin carboxyl-terminal hydrolase isozyme L3 n=1 Tax=Prorops nasuta TaxID=863751 RepID=UPI0034CFB6D4
MFLVPLESNPEVMTAFLHKLGVPKKWGITDVYGLDPDLLAVVPRPVLAVILLYPLRNEYEGIKSIDNNATKDIVKEEIDGVYYLKQYVPNACGTIALLHSVANNTDVIHLENDVLKKFLEETQKKNPDERGNHFMNAQGLLDTHKESALEGQTEVPSEDTPVNYHFVAFVHKNGILYELDGRKDGPIKHGLTTPDTLLEDAARVCKEFMNRDPEEMGFTVVALTALNE